MLHKVYATIPMIPLLLLFIALFPRRCVDFLIRFFRNSNYHKHYVRVRENTM